MIHIVTVHFRSTAWIDRQLRSIRTFAPNATTWASLDYIDESQFGKFDHAMSLETTDLGPGIEPYSSGSDDPAGDRHGLKLNELARLVIQEAQDSDYLLFLDGDAMLLRDIDEIIANQSGLVAVRRDENDGDQFPHPSFCLVSVGQWRKLEGDWRRGEYVTSKSGRLTTDTGTKLVSQLDRHQMSWTPLLRMNSKNLHPVWFGVYGTPELGPVVYHHGAGFRPRVSRADLAAGNTSRLKVRRGFAQRQAALDRKVQKKIDQRPDGWLRLFVKDSR